MIATGTWAVLDRFESNGYHDSDFFEITWDGKEVTVHCTGTTAAAGAFFTNSPKATKTEDGYARAWAHRKLAAILLAEEGKRALEPHEGRIVRSLTTRGKNVGVTGTVRRVELNTYYRGEGQRYRLEVETADGTRRWLDAHRVEVTGGFGEIDPAAQNRKAAYLAQTASWLTLARHLGMRG